MFTKPKLLMLVILGLLLFTSFSVVSADSDSGWIGHYYNNAQMRGEPVLTRHDPFLRFYWGSGKPAPELANADYFSARWSKAVTFDSAKTVVWSMRGDDGYRLFIDGKLIIDRNAGTPLQQAFASVDLAAGSHVFYIEYYEQIGNATADFQYYVGPKVWRPGE